EQFEPTVQIMKMFKEELRSSGKSLLARLAVVFLEHVITALAGKSFPQRCVVKQSRDGIRKSHRIIRDQRLFPIAYIETFNATRVATVGFPIIIVWINFLLTPEPCSNGVNTTRTRHRR